MSPHSKRRVLAIAGALAIVFTATQVLSQPAQPKAPPAKAAVPPAGPPAAPAPAKPPAPPAAPAKAPPPAQPKAAPAPRPATVPAGAAAVPQHCSPSGIARGTTGAALPRGKAKAAAKPTKQQLRALAALQKEAEAYEKDAKDYRAAITRIVRHHYEDKKRRILSSLNREITIEQQGLKTARDQAIKELEDFVAKYNGENAHPKNTPDAMFRLAALYEEKEREVQEGIQVAPGETLPPPDLKKAIALYKRIVVEFPKYDEVAAVFYHLGHAYQDMGRLEESQQVWRSLVCQNHFEYPVPPDPSDPEKDSIARLPQDHEADWWLGWMSRHGEPITTRAPKGAAPRAAAPKGANVVGDEESFRDPYPDDCQGVPQVVQEGEEPRYVAEVWWRLGDYHFDEIDPWGGAFNLNRAERAYRQAMKIGKPPLYGVAMYKLAWTFYKQQRYEDAVKQFVELLHYTDKRQKETGNPGTDFRTEAYAYIAGSMTYVDFEGPGPNDPYIARNDIFDMESDPVVIEEKMSVAIDRVQDNALVPQDKPWTVEIYKALAFEFKEYNQFQNLITLNTAILKKWPMHRDAPLVQNQIAETYEQLAAISKGGEHDKYGKLALESRSRLVEYVATPGNIPAWVNANKDDPEAIRAAERLVRGGLRRAAADHTNAARLLVETARNAGSDEEKKAAFTQALAQYQLAAKAWGGYLLQDENAEDAYESRFWLADAFTNVVIIKVQMGDFPSRDEVEIARCTARDVRDSNEDDRYLQPAALMVVRIAQQFVEANYKLYEDTKGARGFQKMEELQEEGEGEGKKFVKKELPPEVRDMIAAFDEYVSRVPLEKDPFQNHEHFAYTGGEIFFLYGQFDEARKRLYPIYINACGKSKYGYLAWEKLITMANKENNFEKSRELAQASQAKSCAVDDEQKQAESGIRDPSIKRGYYQEAAKAYEIAQKMKDGPERKKAWLRAAQLYEGALKAAPDRKEAPEAAILGASAYKQIGEYDKAIAMYELFIREYGKEEILSKLEKGDGKTQPNKKEYDERVKFLKVAYDALAEAYVLFFNYPKAAQTYETIAKQNRFEDGKQREAARNAVFLYASIGDRPKMADARSTFLKMNPPGTEKAEVDWLIAEADIKEWDERGPNTGTNSQARQRATTAMDDYYRRYSNNRDGYKWAVAAAYNAAKLRRAAKDPNADKFCTDTIKAFDNFKGASGNDKETGRNAALGSPEADMAAECHYVSIDREIKRDFDYDTGHHRYKGVLTEVDKEFKKQVETNAKTHFDKLQEVITKYESRRWAVAARARQGSLYDSARTGLYNTQEPALKLYKPEEERLLKQLDKLCTSGASEKACEQYDTFTANRRTTWRNSRDQLIAQADKAMVSGYVEAIIWAKAWKVRVDSVDRAIARLAFFTEIIGDAKLRQYSAGLKDPQTKQPFVYTDGMFLRMRRGMTTEARPHIMPAPLPVVPTP